MSKAQGSSSVHKKKCSRCGQMIRLDEYATHMERVHYIRQVQDKKAAKRASWNIGGHRRIGERDQLDASKDFYRFRDNGQFGSHPVMDGFDDESEA